MIIPVKCFTCGEVIGNKYRYFQKEVRRIKIAKEIDTDSVIYLNKDKVEKTFQFTQR